jgi:hypothetical protein
MGYESKFYIVEKSTMADRESGMKYASVIAMFDMCKMGSLINVFEKKTDCYIYASDGNTKILEDMYGDALTEATVEDVLYVLEEAVKNGEDYRRIFPLMSALKSFNELQNNNRWSNIVVLHYGY